MGINVLSYLRQTLRKKDKAKDACDTRRHYPVDADWDFGARQTPDTSTHNVRDVMMPRQRSSSLSSPRPSLSRVETPPPIPTPIPMPLAEAPRAGTRDPLPISIGAIVRLEKRASVAVGLQDRMQGSSRADTPVSFIEENRDGADGADDDLSGSATCLAAGEFAKESRGIIGMDEKRAEMRRRVHSIAAARPTDPTDRPVLRHTSSAFMTRDIPLPPTPPPSVDAHSPTRSTHSEIQPQPQAGPSDLLSARRRTLIHAKRSMPQLHNIWENFLEETSKDSEPCGLPNRSSRNPQPMNYTPKESDSGRLRSQQPWRPEFTHPPLPQHMHTPKRVSVLTTRSVQSLKQSPGFSPAELPQLPPSPLSPKSPVRNNAIRRGWREARASRQTSSSSASSYSGSASSMAFSLDSSSACSMTTMTTVYDGDNLSPKKDRFQEVDDDPTVTLNQHTDYIDYSRHHNEILSSPTSIDSHSSDGSQRTVPYSRSNTPLATHTPTSPNHPQTPPTSRSSSRSPTHIRADRHSPIQASAHPRYQAAAQGQWDPTPASPEEVKHKLNTFPRVSAPQRRENFSLVSAGADINMSVDADADSDEDLDDVLSELEFYSPRRAAFPTSALAPTQSQPHSKAVLVPPPRRSSRQNLASLRSKSASSSNLSLAAYERARGSGISGASSVDELGRYTRCHPDQYYRIASPPSTVDTSIPPRSHSAQSAASQWVRQARDSPSPRGWPLSQPTTPTFPSSPPVLRRPLNGSTNSSAKSMNGQLQASRSPLSPSSTNSNPVQWGYAL